MNKFLPLSVLPLLLAGSVTAFAAAGTYTDPDSGFTLKVRPSWMEIGGKNFYGQAAKPDRNETSVNLICAFTAGEVKEQTGKKFTTEEFNKKFKDLQVLERNGLSPDKVNYMVFMPDPYEIKENNRLSLLPKELLENSSIGISTGKSGKQPYVYLHVTEKKDSDASKNTRRVDMQVALTSLNNMLYAAVSVFPLPDLEAQKEIIKEATPFTKEKVRNELNGKNKEKIRGYIDSRRAFIKGLSFFEPGKETGPFGFTDALLGGRVQLPEDWAYVQINEDTAYDKGPLKVTLAAPWNGVSEILKLRNAADADPGREDLPGLNFQKISEIAIFASSEAKNKNAFGELFDTPDLTKLVIDRIIREGFNHPSVKDVLEFKELKTDTGFTESHGTVTVSGSGTLKQNDSNFNIKAGLEFTPKRFGLMAHIYKENEKPNPVLENSIKRIGLSKK